MLRIPLPFFFASNNIFDFIYKKRKEAAQMKKENLVFVKKEMFLYLFYLFVILILIINAFLLIKKIFKTKV